MELGLEKLHHVLLHTQIMNKYKLVSNEDGNITVELESTTFQTAVEESLAHVQWFIVNDGDCYVAVNDLDPNKEFRLKDETYEDAQYETLMQLGYYISSSL